MFRSFASLKCQNWKMFRSYAFCMSDTLAISAPSPSWRSYWSNLTNHVQSILVSLLTTAHTIGNILLFSYLYLHQQIKSLCKHLSRSNHPHPIFFYNHLTTFFPKYQNRHKTDQSSSYVPCFQNWTQVYKWSLDYSF